MPTVEFLDAGKKVNCGQYANLRKVALLAGVEVYKGLHKSMLMPPPIGNCGGNGMCGHCLMEVVEGAENLSPKNIREKLNFQLRGKPENFRLSCQCQVMGDLACITALAIEDQPIVPVKG